MIEGSMDAKVLFISDFLRVNDKAEGRVLTGPRRDLLVNACGRAGLAPDDYALLCIHPACPPGGQRLEKLDSQLRAQQMTEAAGLIRMHKANVLVPLGEAALQFVTGMSGIMKHHCTIMPAIAALGLRKVIPLIAPDIVMRDFVLSAYVSFGCTRIRAEAETPAIDIAKRTLVTDQMTAFRMLKELNASHKPAAPIAIDLEFKDARMTVFGVAWSATHALALDMRTFCLPFMTEVQKLMTGDAPKIFHNFVSDCSVLAEAGIHVNNIAWDTMLAMKLLHPELEKGLDNAARIYTRYPYWKDHAKVGDWVSKLEYNCYDSTATFAASEAQRSDINGRELGSTYAKSLMGCTKQILQMCARGLAINEHVIAKLTQSADTQIESFERTVNTVCLERTGESINARSPSQLKRALKAIGINVPKVKGKETVSKKALQKLRRKHPKEEILPALIGLSSQRKLRDSLAQIGSGGARCNYLLDACFNEFGEWHGYSGVRGTGRYPASVSRKLRNIFVADCGRVLVEANFPDAELRYIAYDAPDARLIQHFESDLTPAQILAGALWQKPADMVGKALARLGSKILLHAAYGGGPRQLVEIFANEHDRDITQTQAKGMIAKCWELYPGIKRRQDAIQVQIRRRKMLSTAFGRQRIFYDRIGDQLFRQAYAYSPRSTVVDATTGLMMELADCELLLHGNDFLLLQVETDKVSTIASRILQHRQELILTAGLFSYKTTVSVGTQWGRLEQY